MAPLFPLYAIAVVLAAGVPPVDDPAPAVVSDKVPADAPPSRLTLHLAAGLAVSRGAGNVSVGVGFAVSERFSIGLDAEYSPWFDYLGGKASPGTFNLYADGSYRWFGTDRYEVRTALFAGLSVLLFTTPGAPAGSAGIILGTNVLRAVVRISPRVAFEISPDAVLVVPSLRGVPLVYPQFRLTAGMRFGLEKRELAQ